LQHFDARLGYCWYCDPAALVVQSVVPHGSIAAVEALNEVLELVLASRGDAIRQAGGLYFFHDWRSLKGYDKAAQARQYALMKARPRGYARRTVIIVSPANRLLRMAVETAGLFATLTLSQRVELATTPVAALGRSPILRPREGSKLA
jgi:hypothetical protein